MTKPITAMLKNVPPVNVSSGHGKAGRHPTRAFLDSLSGHKDPGKFGRMFPKLAPLAVKDEALTALAKAMVDKDPADLSLDNPNVPAGFTYLGQFVDHDITLDLTSLSEKEKDPLAVENFRTPSPRPRQPLRPRSRRQPASLPRHPDDFSKRGPKFLIGKNIAVGFGGVVGDFRNDLQRSPEGMALIGDHRNDENLLVAQTHLAMLKFHNKVVDLLRDEHESAGRTSVRRGPARS